MQLLKRLVILVVGILALSAIFKEWSQPRWMRSGAGDVLGIPYDFRRPSTDDLKERLWNPEGTVVTPPAWGVGFALNVPAMLRRVGLWQ